jgi:hypothetical protein
MALSNLWGDPWIRFRSKNQGFGQPRQADEGVGRGPGGTAQGTAPRLMQVRGYRKSMRHYALVRAARNRAWFRGYS